MKQLCTEALLTVIYNNTAKSDVYFRNKNVIVFETVVLWNSYSRKLYSLVSNNNCQISCLLQEKECNRNRNTSAMGQLFTKALFTDP